MKTTYNGYHARLALTRDENPLQTAYETNGHLNNEVERLIHVIQANGTMDYRHVAKLNATLIQRPAVSCRSWRAANGRTNEH